ncbi:MAG: acyl-ACP--UDP-N-acetylglucosamine O-acyltransferase [Deltaproteobacteria bacterium]|nr:acyl-ACP--UDP-N-acetylglucosamine O-acyltransferase [Deltaproteobacteria bacterium]MBW1818484.1 acyl-ACP--UDP-N-acetylglucosamine O-acyltransferase [Deltaproteobacteria bacterium]MBW2285078.1 acyl-ACP--UDP-N-acetylglucosamine O-acyltransferase [Deltaproteobacteria bacterium]
MEIHPTAVISPKAELGEDVAIGAYSTVSRHVVIGSETRIGSHVVIDEHTQIGERNRIHPFACLGTPPQDIGYEGEETRLIMGNENTIREYVTINRATTKENGETVLGDRNYLMAYAHVAHDCVLGNDIILTNVTNLAGHCRIDDYAMLGGITAVHQFARIGTHAFLSGNSGISLDLPPYMMASGPRARLYGVNQKGLVRRGFSQETIDGLKRAYRIIWRENRRLIEGIAQVEKQMAPFPELEVLLRFLKDSNRGVLRA